MACTPAVTMTACCCAGAVRRLQLKGLGGFAVAPAGEATLAAYVAEAKGSPGFVGVWNHSALPAGGDPPAPLARRSFFRVRRCPELAPIKPLASSLEQLWPLRAWHCMGGDVGTNAVLQWRIVRWVDWQLARVSPCGWMTVSWGVLRTEHAHQLCQQCPLSRFMNVLPLTRALTSASSLCGLM